MEYILLHLDWSEARPDAELYRRQVRLSHKNTMVNLSPETVLAAFLQLANARAVPDTLDADAVQQIRNYLLEVE